ncbi:MAG: radical SAM protein [Halobacteriota archaeon]
MLLNSIPIDLTVPPEGIPSAPHAVGISLTGKCNLSCRYCFFADSMKGKRDLPTERWMDFFKELGTTGVQRVHLSGGEVFTRSDLITLIDGIITNRMRYALISNGTLITDEIIASLMEGKRRLRLDYVQISIDGSCAAIHDLSRPPKSFNRALHGLRLLVEAKFPTTVRVTLNHYNINDLENIAQLLIDDVGLQSFSTNEAAAMGTARCNGENITLSSNERRLAMKKLSELNEQYDGRISASAGPLALAHTVSDIEQSLASGETEIPGRGTLCSCGRVLSEMEVLHDGTMVPCNMIPTLIMGVIGMHSLQDAWLNSPAINTVRHRRDVPLSALPECDGCHYTGLCTGGCPAVVMARSNRLIGIDPLTCYRIYVERGENSDVL